jgi:hypothetical protein
MASVCQECGEPALPGSHLCAMHVALLADHSTEHPDPATCPRCGAAVPSGHYLCARCLEEDAHALTQSYALMEALTRPNVLPRAQTLLASLDVTSLEVVQQMGVPEPVALLEDQIALKEQLQGLLPLQPGTQAYRDQRFEIALTLYRFPPDLRARIGEAVDLAQR